jgi:entericidin B
MKNLTKLVAALALCAAAFTLTACNTTKGVGRDIEAVGDGIEEAASDNGAQ